jgi:hypothetical protein
MLASTETTAFRAKEKRIKLRYVTGWGGAANHGLNLLLTTLTKDYQVLANNL